MSERRVQAWWVSGWPMILLCLLAASRWLLESARPEVQTTYVTQAVGCLMAGGFVALVNLLGQGRWKSQLRPLPPIFPRAAVWTYAGGAVAVAGPALAAAISDRYVNADTATLALVLTPCVVAVAVQAFGEDNSGDDLTARLWPGLAGVAGLLLVVPQPVFHSWRFSLAVVLMPLLTGLGAIFFDRRCVPDRGATSASGRSSGAALALAGLLYGLLAVFSTYKGAAPRFSASAAGFDGLLALLSLISLKHLRATRWVAQFVLVPWLTLVEGALLLRPVLDVRSWVAFALLAVSGVYQLLLR